MQRKEEELLSLESDLQAKEKLLAEREARVFELEEAIRRKDEAQELLKKKVADALIGFEIFLEHLNFPKKTLNDQKSKFTTSDFQKSARDFAFVVNRDVKAQDLINAISSVDQKLISNIKVFDVYEGENIPDNQKSIAINLTIQSSQKTLNDSDLEKINKLIIETVENKTGAKIRS